MGTGPVVPASRGREAAGTWDHHEGAVLHVEIPRGTAVDAYRVHRDQRAVVRCQYRHDSAARALRWSAVDPGDQYPAAGQFDPAAQYRALDRVGGDGDSALRPAGLV